MPFLPSLFRSGRSTPTPATPSRPHNEPPTPSSAASKAPPSAFKVHPSPAPSRPLQTTRGTPSPVPVKVRDFAHSPRSTAESLPYTVRPLPATPADSPLKGHSRSTSGASALSSKSSLKRNGHVAPRPAPPTAYMAAKTHNRSASGPSPSPLTLTTLRARASTFPSLNDHTETEVKAPVTPSSVGPGTISARITRTPESRKRPIALKLRTSNLTPPHSPSPAPMKHTQPAPLFPSTLPGQPRIDASYSLVQSSSTMTVNPSSTLAPRKPSLRRAESAQDFHPPQRPARPRSSSQSKVQGIQAVKGVVQSVSSQTPDKLPQLNILDQEVLASLTPNRPATPFEHVPLPWTSSSASTLCTEIGPRFEELLDFTLQRLPPSSPRVLRPSVLRTSANEDSRLRSELDRLRDKYSSAIRHRTSLLHSVSSVQTSDLYVLRKTTESMKRAIGRCDRLARQIFICNDQIRQIEVQGEEHVVGALRVALARCQGDSASTPASSGSASDFSDVEEKQEEQAVLHQAVFVPTCTPEKDVLEVSSRLAKHHLNRMSTATIISLDQLGFPLPPKRHSPSPTQSAHSFPPIIAPAHPIPDVSMLSVPPTARSASSSELDVTVETNDEILIFPPSHRRSVSVPLLDGPYGLDMPHTPWRGHHDFSLLQQNSGTAPLRVKAMARRQGMGKAKSMTHKRVSSEVTKRASRGRESSLDNPESILWSLATASLWQNTDEEES